MYKYIHSKLHNLSLYLSYILNRMDLDFYLLVDNQEVFLRRATFKNMPTKGETVVLYVNEQNVKYRVARITFRTGSKKDQVFLEKL